MPATHANDVTKRLANDIYEWMQQNPGSVNANRLAEHLFSIGW